MLIWILIYLMPRNACNVLKIANYLAKSSYCSTWNGWVYGHCKKNSRSKDEANENIHSNTIHSPWNHDSSLGIVRFIKGVHHTGCTIVSYFFPDILKWYDDTLPIFKLFRPNKKIGIFKRMNVAFTVGYHRLDLWNVIPFAEKQLPMHWGPHVDFSDHFCALF